MTLIFALSAQPAAESSSLSGGIIRRMLELAVKDFDAYGPALQATIIESFQDVVRMAAHLIAYMVLGALCMLAISRYRLNILRQIAFSLAICIAYAISDEIHQTFVDGRSAQISDLCIDSVGALLGILVIALIFKHWQRRNKLAENSSRS